MFLTCSIEVVCARLVSQKSLASRVVTPRSPSIVAIAFFSLLSFVRMISPFAAYSGNIMSAMSSRSGDGSKFSVWSCHSRDQLTSGFAKIFQDMDSPSSLCAIEPGRRLYRGECRSDSLNHAQVFQMHRCLPLEARYFLALRVDCVEGETVARCPSCSRKSSSYLLSRIPPNPGEHLHVATCGRNLRFGEETEILTFHGEA